MKYTAIMILCPDCDSMMRLISFNGYRCDTCGRQYYLARSGKVMVLPIKRAKMMVK